MIKLLDRIGLIWKITRFQIALRKVMRKVIQGYTLYSRIGFTYCSATCTPFAKTSKIVTCQEGVREALVTGHSIVVYRPDGSLSGSRYCKQQYCSATRTQVRKKGSCWTSGFALQYVYRRVGRLGCMIMNGRAMDVRSVIKVVMITEHVGDSFLITFLEQFWIFCSTYFWYNQP